MTNPLDDPEFVAGLRPIPAPSGSLAAHDVVGLSPGGDPCEVRLADHSGHVVLVFLSVDCFGCRMFWTGLDQIGLPAFVLVRSRTDLARLAELQPGVPVIVGDDAWERYQVSSYPYLIAVDCEGRTVAGEAVGFARSDLDALISELPAR